MLTQGFIGFFIGGGGGGGGEQCIEALPSRGILGVSTLHKKIIKTSEIVFQAYSDKIKFDLKAIIFLSSQQVNKS